jgi:hypothetical protein
VDCEFATGGTTGQLTRTATAVTLFAGALQTPLQPETITLVAHRTDGTTVTSDPVTVDAAGVDKRLSVSSPAGNIDSFTLSADGGDLAFDDLTIDFAANSLPDMRPTTTSQVAPVLAGDQTLVNVDLNRVNNSHGAIRVSASGLPSGVSADPVTADADSVTLVLKAAPDAPSTNFAPTTATITADPLGQANVAPGPRTTTLAVRVASPFELQLAPGTDPSVALAACSATDVPIRVPRDIALKDNVHVSVTGLPPGVTADVLPSPDILPGGGLTAERTIRFTRQSTASLPAVVTVTARTFTGIRHISLTLQRATPTASVAPGFGLTARLGAVNGTQITLSGTGFCPGTTVQVGNTHATATTERVDDHTVTFTIPPLATSGPVTVFPQSDDSPFTTSNALQVDSFRNTDGFQFANFGFGSLSIDELTDAFGADDLFISVNPCGLWGGHCKIQTGILDPIAAIDWGVLDIALSNTNGHCFGISRAVQQLLSGHKPLYAFTTGGSIFGIPSAAGPSDFLTSYLDGQHALQGSDEFLHAWFNRDKSVAGQASRLDFALAGGDFPIVTLQHGGAGHAVIAYNASFHLDGTVVVDTYDNNRPFTPSEDTNGDLHQRMLQQSVLNLDTVNGSWSYVMADGERWSGGNGGTLFVAPQFTIPQDPSLPGIQNLQDALEYVVFGSANGTVRTAGAPRGADYLPALDSHAVPSGAGTIVAKDPRHPLATDFVGVKRGHYSGAFIGKGFAASVTDVATTPGTRDTLRGQGEALTFRGGRDRPLTVDLAQRPTGPRATAWAATLHTTASAHGSDAAALTDHGTLAYTHDGAPTTVRFTLSGLDRVNGPTRFDSGPVSVARGDRLTVTPRAGLRSVGVTIRDRRGRTHRAVLRNRATPPAHVTVATPALTATRAAVRVGIRGLRGRAAIGVVMRVFRGRRLLATRAASRTHVANGSRRFAFRLPRGLRGRYRLRTDVRLLTTATRGVPTGAGTTASWTATVIVPGRHRRVSGQAS